MPEGYTHVRTARKAAETIHYKIQCPAAFAAGANGPDSFFCFEIWKKRAKRRYDLPGLGNRMHEEKTGAFLRSLCANVKTRPQVEYTLGFLSHYAADTVVHPFICAMCAPGQPYAGKGGHGYLEIALDSTLHAEDTGSALVPVDDVSPLPTGEELADIQRTAGGGDGEWVVKDAAAYGAWLDRQEGMEDFVRQGPMPTDDAMDPGFLGPLVEKIGGGDVPDGVQWKAPAAPQVRVTFKDKGRALEALERRPATVERLLGGSPEPPAATDAKPEGESDIDGLFAGLGL